MTAVDFTLPEGMEATEPPPLRDGVRLLVAGAGGVEHASFSEIGKFLAAGDLVVVNTSATLAAAVDGSRAGGPVEVHFSAELDDGSWVVEVRPAGAPTGPVGDLRPGEDISDRPAPEAVVPALLRLIATRPPSGRVRAADLTGTPA